MHRLARNIIAGFIGMILNNLGFVDTAKRKITKGCILPIYFHKPRKNLFRNIIIWLKDNNFIFISTKQLVDIIQGKLTLKEKLAWISFDDGWKHNIDNVIPTIVEYNIPATFFITTDPIENTKGLFWWSIIRKNRKKLPLKYRKNLGKLWSVPEAERRKVLDNVTRRIDRITQREAMTVQDVKDIAKLPQITIGSHTVHHAISMNCTEHELESEIRDSKIKIEKWIGKEVKYFSYPNGDFDGRERYILKKYGFELAATTENFVINANADRKLDLFFVPRHAVVNDGYFCEAICHVVGVWQPFMRKIKEIWGRTLQLCK